jgi:hypothetical protein
MLPFFEKERKKLQLEFEGGLLLFVFGKGTKNCLRAITWKLPNELPWRQEPKFDTLCTTYIHVNDSGPRQNFPTRYR